MTFCPLCNTAIVFERTVGGRVLDFGTTGRLRFSNLLIYDRQTESWWQQAIGQAIIALWVPGTSSPLDAGTIAGGRDVGSATVYMRVLGGRTLTFGFDGTHIVTNAMFVKASLNGQKKVVTARQGDRFLTFEADEILVTLGRRPSVEGLNLAAAGVICDHKGIKVDAYLQTTASHILAIGDVIGGYLFTNVAAYQAGIAVRNALVPVWKKKVDYRVVPWCTFTDPEAARIGLTPDEAGKQYKDMRIVRLPWAEIDRAQAEGETTGFIKLVLAGKKDEIVGPRLVGSRAGELLGELSLAM